MRKPLPWLWAETGLLWPLPRGWDCRACACALVSSRAYWNPQVPPPLVLPLACCPAALVRVQFLRLFQSGGSQAAVLCLPGSVVTMTGEGPLLAMVYHRSPPAQDCQVLAYMLWRVPSNGCPQLLASGDVPMAPDAQLAWLGFSTTHVRTSMCLVFLPSETRKRCSDG